MAGFNIFFLKNIRKVEGNQGRGQSDLPTLHLWQLDVTGQGQSQSDLAASFWT